MDKLSYLLASDGIVDFINRTIMMIHYFYNLLSSFLPPAIIIILALFLFMVILILTSNIFKIISKIMNFIFNIFKPLDVTLNKKVIEKKDGNPFQL